MENINAKRATRKEEYKGKVCWGDYWFPFMYFLQQFLLCCGWRKQPSDVEGNAHIPNKQSRTADKGWSFNLEAEAKVKQSRYRPGVAQRVPGS